mgnify:CR=1 FL=1
MSTGTGPPGEGTTYELLEVHARLMEVLRRRQKLTWVDDDLTMPQLKVLVRLYADGPCSAGRLAEELGVSRPAVTGFVDRLEGKGLLRRRRHPSDRRALMIELTAEGSRRVEAVYDAHRREMAALFAQLAPEDQRALLQGLRALCAVAEGRGLVP